MAVSKPLYIYADLETEGFKGLKLLQIAAITANNEVFSIYINPREVLPANCLQITGLYFHKNQLYRNGQVVPSVSITVALRKFKNWLEAFERPIHLVFHNGFAFDMQVLTRHFLNQNIPFPPSVVNTHDTLPIFRKYIKVTDISGFKLGALAEHIKVPLLDAHNAVSDAECLKNICETFVKQKEIDLDEFLNSYIKPVAYFQRKLKPKK